MVQGTAEDKVVGMGQGTRQSPRHLSCLLSRTNQTGCDGCDDCGGPRSNVVDWATQVSRWTRSAQGLRGCREEGPLTWVLYETQIKQGVLAKSIGRASKESWPGALAKQARSLGREYWPSKQGVRVRIFSSYQVKIQQYVGTKMQ